MSSLGSSGSSAGACARERAGQVEHAEAGRVLVARLADVARAEADDLRGLDGVSSGRAARTQATAAETIGAENDVPSTRAKPSVRRRRGRTPPGTAVRMPMPGRARSTAALSLEKNVGLSSGPIAPTVSTCGEARRELERVALLELVAGGGDRDGAGADRALDLLLLGDAARRASRSSC